MKATKPIEPKTQPPIKLAALRLITAIYQLNLRHTVGEALVPSAYSLGFGV
jgi:hypothetical protein